MAPDRQIAEIRRRREMAEVEPFERIDRIEVIDDGCGAGRRRDDEGIAAGSAGERVVTLTGVDRVATGTAGDRVVAAFAVENVVAAAASEMIAERVSEDRIVAGAAVDVTMAAA